MRPLFLVNIHTIALRVYWYKKIFILKIILHIKYEP